MRTWILSGCEPTDEYGGDKVDTVISQLAEGEKIEVIELEPMLDLLAGLLDVAGGFDARTDAAEDFLREHGRLPT